MLSERDKNVSSKDKAMSDVLYAQKLFDEAFPERRYGSVKALLNEAQKFISRRVSKDFTHRRARSIREGAARRIDGEEIDALRLAVAEENRREQNELRARLVALDEKLARADAVVAGQTVARVRQQESRVG